jgi:hypothetical protein
MIWIARPKIHLPARLQRQLEAESSWKKWTRRFWGAHVAGVSVVSLNSSSAYLALHGDGKWSIVSMMLSNLPLVWLVDKAVWSPVARPEHRQATSDLVKIPR